MRANTSGPNVRLRRNKISRAFGATDLGATPPKELLGCFPTPRKRQYPLAYRRRANFT